ncbi:hypothetical protein GCM10010094_72020 [Streptomyces flaveus]|uniref:HTH gntR-type domain-containing protein n=1 Tax=Streptomyces flaveus TaxID=66370 RepID=A0A917RDH4_9ACTN|nr:hypothetical protein GCM10010094_72020 [Streptomyces flaveus]
MYRPRRLVGLPSACAGCLSRNKHGTKRSATACPSSRAAADHQATPDLKADHIAAHIASGELRPGARLPGERDLAAEYGVAHLTARRATSDRGFVVTLPAKGTFVAYPDANEPADDSQE